LTGFPIPNKLHPIWSKMETNHYDLLGIGFGPSNISLAIALKEMSSELRTLRPKIKFFERQATYHWHHNLLIPGATMQITFLKDLVTQRNPQSHYTFLNFLKKTNRLDDFINLRELYPCRMIFAEYLTWAASSLHDLVDFGSEVASVEPVPEPTGEIKSLRIAVRTTHQASEEYICKNLVIAVGGKPKYIVNGVEKCPRVIHSNEFLTKLNRQLKDRDREYRLAVVGAGQSAAEMCMYLYANFPKATIYNYFSGFAYKSCDANPFLNELFINRNTDLVYFGNNYTRNKLLDHSTNYGVVDKDDLKKLYDIVYNDRIFSRERLILKNFSVVKNIKEIDGSHVTMDIDNKNTGSSYAEDFDGVFLGTGFDRTLSGPLLEHLTPYLKTESNSYIVNRDYSLRTSEDMGCKIFVQGASEKYHGIPNSLLSVLAYRAKEIAGTVLGGLNGTTERVNIPENNFAH
jgi:L-ornithine N5-oxygenase